MTINIAINFTLVKVYCHKFMDMEIWHRPRATYPGSPRLNGLTLFKLHKPVSTLLENDATLCTLYLFFYSHKAAAFFMDFVAIENMDTCGHLWAFCGLAAIEFVDTCGN